MKIKKYQVIIKPSLAVLVGAIVVYGVATQMAGRYAKGKTATYGFAHPERWKFETMGKAEAALTPHTRVGGLRPAVAEASSEEASSPKARTSNADDGFTVAIKNTDRAAYDVYLRNAMNLADADPNKSLALNFEAQSSTGKFPIIFTVRGMNAPQSSSALWSKQFTVSSDWKNYSAIIPMESLKNEQYKSFIISAQLGSQKGNVSFRHIYVR